MFLLLSCNSFLCILICDLCFLPFFGLSFHFIDNVFWSTKVLNFDDTNLFFICLLIAKKESYLRNHCPIQGHEDLALCFLLGTFIFIYFFLIFIYLFIYFISWRLITLQYCSGFCHTLTWISHGYTSWNITQSLERIHFNQF